MRTARRKAITRAQLRHFEEAYGAFPVPVTVTNEAREFVFVNAACCAYYGKKPEDLLGRTAAALVDAEGLKRQEPVIREFNEALGTRGHSIRRFTNLAQGKEVRVLVVAFGRTMRNRHVRVGVAIPEQFTSMVPGITRLLLRGDFDVEGFIEDLARTAPYRELMRELSTGTSLKEARAYRGERNNRKALDRIVSLARKRCDDSARKSMTVASLKHLAVLLADRLAGV